MVGYCWTCGRWSFNLDQSSAMCPGCRTAPARNTSERRADRKTSPPRLLVF
jgi:hypothetical protein